MLPLPAAEPREAALEGPLSAVEQRLSSLGQALARNDAGAIESEAVELHRALAVAVDRFTRAARSGGVPPAMRRRLALAGGRVAAQREALARATASLDRAIDVLLPAGHGTASAVYAAGGGTERGPSAGALVA